MKRAFLATSMMLVALSLTGCGPLRWTGGDSDGVVASGTLEAEETVIAPPGERRDPGAAVRRRGHGDEGRRARAPR